VLAARGQVRALLNQAQRGLKTVTRMIGRGRVREVATRAARALLPPKNDDEDGLVLAN
jgi:hypothetical protein